MADPIQYIDQSEFPEELRQRIQSPTTLPSAEPFATGTTQRALEFGKRAAAPTIGGAIGGMVGTAVGGPFAPLTGPVGMGVGSAAGLYANKLMGLEQPTLPDYLAAGGLGMFTPALRTVTKELPGAAGGLQEAAATKLQGIPGMVAPAQPSSVLYGTLPKGLRIPLTNLSQAAASVLTNEGKIAPKIRVPLNTRMADAANELVTSAGTGVPEDVFRANLTRFGELVRNAHRKGGLSERAASKLFGAMMDDLDATAAKANSPYAAMLREAAGAYKHELAQDRLTDLLGMGGATRFQLGRKAAPGVDTAMTKIASDPQLAKWLSLNEIKDVLAALEPLAKVPNVNAMSKPGLEGMPFAMRAAVGGTLGAAIGGGPVSAVTAIGATELLARTLMSPYGRAVVKSMALHGMTWDQIGNALGQLGRAGLSMQTGGGKASGPVQLGQPPQAPRPMQPGRALPPTSP